jgi:hypothetical protein
MRVSGLIRFCPSKEDVIMQSSRRNVIAVLSSICLLQLSLYGQTEKDYVNGNLVTFNANGAWCWFQDERALVDTVKQKLLVASAEGNGNNDVVIYDLKTKKVENKTMLGNLSVDDHNSPALLILPGGNYLTLWAQHYDKYYTRYSIYNGSKWSAEKKFDWKSIPGGTNYTIAYNNVYYLSAEQKIYNFSRANNKSPNFLVSTDTGATWKFGGQLSTDVSDSYNRGYYKYWGNGVDRIDFCCTEQHPRDYTTSIYHGYIKGGMCHTSDGMVVDSNIFDVKDMPVSGKNFTRVFANGTKVNGISMVRCWESDLQVYEDSSIAILFEARANNSETDHRNFYSRYDGKEWKTTYIGKAGGPMYSAEEDYTGLGALCPNDPNTMYISSPFNPGDDNSKAGKREIWKGVTGDHGATWKWTAITANSSKDNFRPIVPAWNKENTALLWWKGTYTSAQIYSAAVVGVFYNNDGTKTSITKTGKTHQCTFFVSHHGTPDGLLDIRYSLPYDSHVSIQLINVSGKMVAVLMDRTLSAGENAESINMPGIPSGIYLCKIQAGAYSRVLPLKLLF